MSLYLVLNLASFFVPILFSFDKRMNYGRRWRAILASICITASIFIIWDIIFTKIGVWHFNEKYHCGIAFFDLPLEEWLFFVCIPYSSIFLHFAFQYFFPHFALSPRVVSIAFWTILLLAIPTAILNTDKWYTVVNYSYLVVVLVYAYLTERKILESFFFTFLLILVPFSAVNGILTGSFIDEPVVYYNNAENLGIRLGTIPIEDIGYAFSMLLSSLILIEKFEKQ